MNKRLWITVTTLILLSFSAAPLYAQFSGNIDVRFTPEQDELNLGDPVNLLLEVTHPAGSVAAIPSLPEVWGDFEVRAQSKAETVDNGDGTAVTGQTIEVTLFNLGTFQTPTWSVAIKDPAGDVTERAVPQASLTVAPVLTGSDRELRDIKAQVDLPLPPIWPWIVLGALLGLFFILLIYRLYNRFKGKFKKPTTAEEFIPQPYIDPRPAHVIAFEELERIERLDLPGQGRFKEYYTLVTDTMRRYIERRYNVPAMDYTTAEIQIYLQQAAIEPDDSRQFIALFASSDYVKFARLIPKMNEARRLMDEARHLIDLTKIVETPVSAKAEPMAEVLP